MAHITPIFMVYILYGPLPTAVTSFGGVIVTAYGWSTLFYVSAALTLVWAIIWSGITRFFLSVKCNLYRP